jgi:hypothetical protein
MPTFSVRVDPLNWLLDGHLGFEVEVGLLEWLTVESIPMFVASKQPPIFNSVDELEQAGNGIGALAGASLGVGFWLNGTAFRGDVLRVGINHYSVEYTTRALEDEGSSSLDPTSRGDILDRVVHNRTRLAVLFGSHKRWGFFTLAGGIGLEYEMNDTKRCLDNESGVWRSTADPPCDDDQLQIARDRLGTVSEPRAVNLYDWLHPFYPVFRFSLGVVIGD